MKILYTAKAEAKGGRDGHFKVLDGNLEGALAMPKSLGGTGGPAANPEQLFAAGYAACFASAVKHVAMKEKKTIEAPIVTAQVSLGTTEDGGFGLAAKLTLVVPGLDKAATQALADKAHQVCPYSRATRGNVPVEITAAV